MPKNLVTLSLGVLLMFAGCPREPTVTPDGSEPQPTAELPKRPIVDAKAMMASIEWLASDERHGRYTLSPEIEQSATWISERYQEIGLEPVSGADSLRVGYQLRTKVEAGEGSRLTLTRDGKLTAVAADQFTPRGEGISGKAKGELVFVGYGLSWERPDGETTVRAEFESYDDLAGIDLRGKVALVLAYGPNIPDFYEFLGATQKIAEKFEADAGPLRQANDLKKLAKLHRKAREDLAELVAGFIEVEKLGDSYWKVEDPKSPLDVMALISAFVSLAADRPQFDPAFLQHSVKLERLAAAGAAGVILVQGPRSFLGAAARKADALHGPTDAHTSAGSTRVLPDPISIPVVQMRWTSADKLLTIDGQKLSKVQAAIDADYQPRSKALGVEVEIDSALAEVTADVPNVLAQLPGKSDEIILLGAHFDHIGTDQVGSCRAIVRRDDRDAICNGADDNASGTAMLLELARIYKQSGVTPERTIVFAHFSGEEIGLLGSRALMSHSPFDQQRVVAMVNLDMVGRLGPRGLFVGGIGSSNDWMPLLDELGNYGMQILYEGSTTTRSDHAHWFRNQIPVLFFFTGTHGDYHRAGDEIDEINVEGLTSIGQMVSDLVWELASGRSIAWTPPVHGDGIGSGLPGTDPTTVIKHVAEDGSLVPVEE